MYNITTITQRRCCRKGDKMFKKDDIVMYASQGVCKITDIVTQEICNKPAEYYVLQPVYSQTAKVYVPVANAELTQRMRRVLSKKEIDDMLDNLPDPESDWIENEHIRKAHYREILSGSDRVAIICMIRELYIHRHILSQQGKKLHSSDERFFKEAEKILYDEFALVLDIKTDEVLPYIKKRLGFSD